MSSDVIIRRIDIDHDAGKLADMWTASDLQWPSSFTQGVPFDEALVREWYQEERCLAVFVAEVDGQIVGYASFMDGYAGREGEGYLDLLNVDPRYQGRSIGRRLIQATIDFSVSKGFQRQTLETWSANFKAVPTYKKTGHFWTPGRSPWMQNFIPGALQMPLAKPFFAKHDWYQSYVRDLKQVEDDQRWEGLKVYTQHWEADDESLTIWIDREARAPVAIETDGILVAGIPAEIEPVAGSTVDMTWRVVNKSEQMLQVFLHAQGDKGLGLDYRDVFQVAAGVTVERTAQIKVNADAPSSKDDGTTPAVHSILRLNDQELDLYAGVRAKKALHLDTAPAQLSSTPGAPLTVQLQLHSERAEDTRLVVQLTPPQGLTVDWQRREVQLPAKGHLSVPLSIMATESIVYTLPVHVADMDGQLDPIDQTLDLFCVAAGGILAQQNADGVRLETSSLRVNAEAKEGAISVMHKDRQAKLLGVSVNVGRPYYWPTAFQKRQFTIGLAPTAGGYEIKMAAEARHDKGLYLHQVLNVSAGGIGTLRAWLENRNDQPCSKRIRLDIGTCDRESESLAMALPEGIVVSHRSEFPTAEGDVPRDPAGYAEPWLAWEHRGLGTGVAWNEAVGRISQSWGMQLDSLDLNVEPGGRSREVAILWLASQGDWRGVREAALRWRGTWSPDPTTRASHPQPRGVAQARLEPELLVTLDDTAAGHLVVDNLSARPADGQALVQVDGGNPNSLAIKALKRGHVVEQDVAIALPAGQLGVYHGQAQLSLDLMQHTSTFDVVRLGLGGAVEVSSTDQAGQPLWHIDNGRTRFSIAPEFGPSLIAWQHQGQNQLWSAFPEPQGLAWQYPWFGGLHAILFAPETHLYHGLLHREAIVATPTAHQDASGITWQGVRLSAQPSQEKLRDLAVELDYETVGGSNVLRVAYRVRNLRDAEQQVRAGVSLAAQLGAERPQDLTAHAQGVQHHPAPWGRSVHGKAWAALVNQATGRTMVLIGRRNNVGVENMGQHGRTVWSLQTLRLPAMATVERVNYLVLTESLAAARAYAVLQNL